MSEKVIPLVKDSYLAVIKNSVGSKMFKNFYAKVNGQKKDILNNGMYSCTCYVSAILLMFNFVKKIYATIKSFEKDLIGDSWCEIKKPKIGCIIIWALFDVGDGDPHRHIGFYIGNGKAVSTNYKKGQPHIHSFNNRPIERFYWHKGLDK